MQKHWYIEQKQTGALAMTANARNDESGLAAHEAAPSTVTKKQRLQ